MVRKVWMSLGLVVALLGAAGLRAADPGCTTGNCSVCGVQVGGAPVGGCNVGGCNVGGCQVNVICAEGGSCAGGSCGAGNCNGGCAEKWCQPAVETKKVDKRVYGEACHDFCYPPLFGHAPQSGGEGCGACAACGDGAAPCVHCGHPHTRRILVVKIRKQEKLVNTCKVMPGGEDAPTTELGERERLGSPVPSAGPGGTPSTAPGSSGPSNNSAPGGSQKQGERERLGNKTSLMTPILLPAVPVNSLPNGVYYTTVPQGTPVYTMPAGR